MTTDSARQVTGQQSPAASRVSPSVSPRETPPARATFHSPLFSRQSLVAALVLISGCTSPKSPEPAPVPPPPRAAEVVAAEKLFDAGQMQDAIIACVDIARKNPEAAGLTDLQQRITEKLAEERMAEAEKRSGATTRLHTADAKKFSISPDTYRQRKHVVGENAPLRTAPSAMQRALALPVTVHLVNADINAIIAQIGQSQNINIIADSEISEKALTIHAENTPLIEILEYIGRNLNVTFSVGDNLIWVTPKEEETSGVPMETRVYRLRKGMVGTELGKSAQGVSLFKGPEERGRGSGPVPQQQQGEKKEGQIGLLESIERFVPQPDGADFLFNDKVHALIVKNTRENLELVENLIEAIDVRPVQILIEARFVTTSITDLRKLGVEWLFDNRGNAQFEAGSLTDTDPWLRGNTRVRPVRRDVITGTFEGVTESGTGGGALAYQFLLGDTALQAVLHALEMTGESRTVVVPRVTTLNNREARFRVGEDTSYFEEVDTSIMTSGSSYGSSESRDNVTYDYDRPTIVETGYSLIVTPSVGADLSAINMVLRPEISAIKEWKKYQLSSLSRTVEGREEPQIEIPIISRQYIETEAVVRSGETVVLGGLVDTSKEDDSSGTPWLSGLPLIGRLFKTDSKKETSKNILIFVTATLISDVGEELIPLNEMERYGLEVPPEATVPEIIKPAPADDDPEAPPAAPPVRTTATP
jgi:type II secretory pathway component GspD/PulD (secretin)